MVSLCPHINSFSSQITLQRKCNHHPVLWMKKEEGKITPKVIDTVSQNL